MQFDQQISGEMFGREPSGRFIPVGVYFLNGRSHAKGDQIFYRRPEQRDDQQWYVRDLGTDMVPLRACGGVGINRAFTT